MRKSAGKKNQKRIGDIGNGPEQPNDKRYRNNPRQYNRQAGPEIGLPSRQETIVHMPNLGVPQSFLKLDSSSSLVYVIESG
jgi:hypothetical protein